MKTSNIVVAASFIWLLVSFWNRNELPGNLDYVAEMQREPTQKPTIERPFEAKYEGVNYLVEPQFVRRGCFQPLPFQARAVHQHHFDIVASANR